MKEGGPERRRFEEAIRSSAETIGSLHSEVGRIAAIGAEVVRRLESGGKVLTAGNGGSAAEALHMAEELVGRFRSDRRSLAAVSLVSDPTALTCIGNDFGFDRVFSRQVEGLGAQGDILVLFSTSGRGKNLEMALQTAEAKEMKTVCLLGRDGGALAGRASLEIIVKSDTTERIQEAHQVIMHLILDAVERAFQE